MGVGIIRVKSVRGWDPPDFLENPRYLEEDSEVASASAADGSPRGSGGSSLLLPICCPISTVVSLFGSYGSSVI